MESQKIGIDKIEAIVESIKHVVIAVKKISADKKIDVNDIPAAMDLLVKLPEIVENFKAFGAVLEQGKDLDVAEVVMLIQKIDAVVKEIEKA